MTEKNQGNKIAIFDFYLGGHHIEYLHHIYMNAIKDTETSYTFILPNNFERFGRQMSWPKVENIRFLFFELDDMYVRGLKTFEKSRLLSRLLKHFIDETQIDHFVLIETMVFMPYLPLYVRNNVKITSILYHLPLYCTGNSLKNKLYNSAMMCLMAFSPCLNKICLLNSNEAVIHYNKKFLTKKFCFLPDPYIPIECDSKSCYIRETLGIAPSKTIFIHLGELMKRKGTLAILDALFLVEEENLKDKCFVFAGRVIEDIKEEFYEKVNLLKNKVQIIVFDQFCEYVFFAEICKIANYIIIPYRNTAQSSGVCSYAAQFNVPVIGSGEGLLGSVIEKYGLGIGVKNLDSIKIAEILNNSSYKNIKNDEKKNQEYLTLNTPKNFFHCLIHK